MAPGPSYQRLLPSPSASYGSEEAIRIDRPRDARAAGRAAAQASLGREEVGSSMCVEWEREGAAAENRGVGFTLREYPQCGARDRRMGRGGGAMVGAWRRPRGIHGTSVLAKEVTGPRGRCE